MRATKNLPRMDAGRSQSLTTDLPVVDPCRSEGRT